MNEEKTKAWKTEKESTWVAYYNKNIDDLSGLSRSMIRRVKKAYEDGIDLGYMTKLLREDGKE